MSLVTEKEASTLWCPMARIARRENTEPDNSGVETLVGGCNTDALGGVRVPASCRCIASKCAMWRWGSPSQFGGMDTSEFRSGYCGLAGPVVQS